MTQLPQSPSPSDKTGSATQSSASKGWEFFSSMLALLSILSSGFCVYLILKNRDADSTDKESISKTVLQDVDRRNSEYFDGVRKDLEWAQSQFADSSKAALERLAVDQHFQGYKSRLSVALDAISFPGGTAPPTLLNAGESSNKGQIDKLKLGDINGTNLATLCKTFFDQNQIPIRDAKLSGLEAQHLERHRDTLNSFARFLAQQSNVSGDDILRLHVASALAVEEIPAVTYDPAYLLATIHDVDVAKEQFRTIFGEGGDTNESEFALTWPSEGKNGGGDPVHFVYVTDWPNADREDLILYARQQQWTPCLKVCLPKEALVAIKDDAKYQASWVKGSLYARLSPHDPDMPRGAPHFSNKTSRIDIKLSNQTQSTIYYRLVIETLNLDSYLLKTFEFFKAAHSSAETTPETEFKVIRVERIEGMPVNPTLIWSESE